MRAYRCFDPLYGRTVLTGLEARLLQAPEVQRLRSIRMCNINSLLISGASQISRFEHSLGVVRLAQEWSNASSASEEETTIVSAAAMLHDIKTGPFGHSLEYALSDNPDLPSLDHERVDHSYDGSYFQRTSANVSYFGARFTASEASGKFWPAIAQTIAGEGPLGPLISGSIDLDNIDNVIRLAYHVGLATRDDGRLAIKIARDMRVVSGIPSITSDSIPAIERWQLLRHRLYRFLLHDWAEFSAKAMLTKAIELATHVHLIGADSWIYTDEELVRRLISSTIGESQEIGELMKRIMLANLYEPVAIVRSSAISSYTELSNPHVKRKLEDRFGEVLKCKCVIHAILDKAKTDRRIEMFLRDQREAISLGEDSQEILVGLFTSRVQSDSVLSRASLEFSREMRRFLPDHQVLPDPLEDPFEAVSEQLPLI